MCEAKRAPDPRGLKLQMIISHQWGCWESNPGLMEEQPVFVTVESAVHSLTGIWGLEAWARLADHQTSKWFL